MAVKVSINKDLEARIRYLATHGREDTFELGEAVGEIVKLLDEAHEKSETKRAAGSKPGLGYKELVALFRSELGGQLALPPAPSPSYIVRIVNKAKEQGISTDNVQQICRGLRRVYPRGPYDLNFIVFRASAHYHSGGSSEDVSGTISGDTEAVHRVYSGRLDDIEG